MRDAPRKSTTSHRGILAAFPAREAPAASPWQSGAIGLAVPDDRPEPVLAMAEIQGNVVAGFNKSCQALLYYHIEEASLLKPILAKLSYLVATADEVLAFNRLFKQMRDRRGQPSILRSAWINVAFSFRGLKRLGARDADLFVDRCFRSGLVEHSKILEDPTGPDDWKVNDGDGENAADILIIVAADTEDDLAGEVQKVKDLIGWQNGAQLVEEDQGRNLPCKLAGHEHFGFLDGISQPGIRGRASDVTSDLVTPRLNPRDRNQGKPGQDLIWPGEFVFGYPDQDGSRNGDDRGGNSMIDGAGYRKVPNWAKDGSYLVFRRLRQEVPQFHAFLHAGKKPDETAQAFAARLVGRWPSGAPLLRARDGDDPDLGNNDCSNNHFGYMKATEPVAWSVPDQCPRDTFPPAGADLLGMVCPRNAHIRKVNPRDELDPVDQRRHRVLRRGIPFGPPSASTIDAPLPAPDKGDPERGLLFLAYMTSIVDQFEFVMRNWVHETDFPRPGAGPDALLAANRWVVPTGGGYYFTPSVSALRAVLSK